MKLYEINEAYYQWLEKVQENEGEVTPELMIEFENIGGDHDTKTEAYAVIIKQLQAESEALKAEKLRLADRQAQAERAAERLKYYLSESMRLFGKDRFKSPKCELSFRKSTAVNLTDETLIPDNYFKVSKSVAKSEILAALKAGVSVPGAELKESFNLQVR